MAYVRHGMTDHPFKKVWDIMNQRVTNPKNPGYKNYGGRGITICERWASFMNFREDMLATYRPGLFLDRVDNDGPYARDNCRWATRLEQNANRRRGELWRVGSKPYRNSATGLVGVGFDKRRGSWFSQIQVNRKRRRLGTFPTKEAAAEAYRMARLAVGQANV
jgi:hypothetical protein